MTRSPHETVGLVLRVGRWLHRRRLELGLALAASAARVVLAVTVGLPSAEIVLGALGVALVLHPAGRAWLVGLARHEHLERRFDRAFDACGIEVHLAPRVLSSEPSRAGTRVVLGLAARLDAEKLSDMAEPLAVALGARQVRVVRDPAHAGRAELLVDYRDPLAGDPTLWPWVTIGSCDLWGGVPFGVDENGALVVLDLVGHHLLLGGEPGAGKSNALSLVVAAAALDPSIELWCFDGKLVELAPWRRVARRFVGADVAEATRVLKELRAEMDDRYRLLLETSSRKVTKDSGLGLVVVVIDELALYLQGRSKDRDELADVLRDIVARGRAAGIVVVAATQKPAADVIPTAIRDLFGYRLALRCATRDASDTVLGAGWATQGYSAADIDAAQRGGGWLLAEGAVPRRLRCFVLGDRELLTLAERAEALRSRP